MSSVSMRKLAPGAAALLMAKPADALRINIKSNNPKPTYDVTGNEEERAEIFRVTQLLATTPDTVERMTKYFGQKKPSAIDSAEAMEAYTASEIWNNMQTHGKAIASAQIGNPKTQAKPRAVWAASSFAAAVTYNAWTVPQMLAVSKSMQGEQRKRLDTLKLWSSSSTTFAKNKKTPAAWNDVDLDTALTTIATGVGCDAAMVSEAIEVLKFYFHDIPITLEDVRATFAGDPVAFHKVKELFVYVKNVALNLKGQKAILPGMIGTTVAAKEKTQAKLGLPPFILRPWLQSDHLPATMLAKLPKVGGFEEHPIVELFNWNVLGRGLANMQMPNIPATEAFKPDRPKELIANAQSVFQLVAFRKKVEQLSAHVLPKGLNDNMGVHISVLASQEDLFVHKISDKAKPDQEIELAQGAWTKVIKEHGYKQAFDVKKSWHNGLPPGAKREAFAKFTLDNSGGSVVAKNFSPMKGAAPKSVETPEFDKDENGKATQEYMMGNTVYIKFSDSFKNSACKPKVVNSGWNSQEHEMYPNKNIPFRSVAIAFVVCQDMGIVAAFVVGHLAGGKFDDNEIFNEVLKGHYVHPSVKLEDPKASPWGKAYAQMTDDQKQDLPPSAKGEEGFNLYYQGAGDLIRTMVQEFIRQVYVAADNNGLSYAQNIPIMMPMDMNAKPDMPFFVKHVYAAFSKELQEASMKMDAKAALLKAQEVAVTQLIPVAEPAAEPAKPQEPAAQKEGCCGEKPSAATTEGQQQQEEGCCR
ncbi:unnamed protein product [Amoebophrya sp. A25]|nr:unnamed protein product [Amoebophrya sp. A25]|eukprot:GSA25T00017588001.1